MDEKTRAGSDLNAELKHLRRRVAELSEMEVELGRIIQRLRHSEEIYRILVDTSPMAVTVTDLNARITHVSELTLRIHGFEDASEMLGLNAVDLIVPEDRPRAERALVEALNRGVVENREYTMLKKDGGAFVAELHASLMRDSDGNPYALVVMSRDISQRKKMESALRASEERYRDLVENVNDAIFQVDPAGVIIYISPAVESILGYKPSQVLGHRISEFVHPDDVKIAEDRVQKVMSGCLEPSEVRCITSTGQVKWVRTSSRTMLDNGRVVGIQGTLTDVDERRKAEKRIAFLGSIIEKLKDAVMVTDLDYKIVYVNDAAVGLFGYSKKELLGKNPDMLNAEPMAETVQKEIYETVSAGGVWEAAIRNRRKDGSIFINEVRVLPLPEEDGAVDFYIAIQRDVTERKRLQQELLQAQKMEAIGTMAGGIAHDFNNLLTAIIGYSELLLESCEPGSVMRNDVEEIGRTARSAATLTRQLLSFGRRQAMRPAPVDLSNIVAGLDKMLQRLISEDIELTTELGQGLERVEADAGQLEQVIVNLILNSRDAMPDGGKLSVKTESVVLDEQACSGNPDALPGKWVKLTVSDSGSGMSPEVLSRIFEPFYTTKEIGKGSGLGLSVVYGIVKQHGGWIDIKSKSRKGTSVSVYLPPIKKRLEEESVREVGSLDIDGGGKKVLLVEDQDEVRKLAERTLKDKGYVVCAAADASEAMEVYSAHGGRFDIVFSDVVLPEGGGLDLAGRIRADNPRIPILLTSGYTDQRPQWSVIEKRGYGFISKPYNLVELIEAIRDTLASAKSHDGKT